jgi:uncharacterized membrane protein YfcA
MNSLKQLVNGIVLGNYLTAGLIGLCSGIISGLFGVGGGIVLVPAMMFFMGMGIHQAVGSSLVVIIPTALMGAFQHHRLGHIDWKIILPLVPMAVVGGFWGAWLTAHIGATNLKRAFGGFIILVGLRLLFGK